MTLPRLYSMQEALEYLGVAVKTLRHHVDQGDIRFIRFGKRIIRFAESDLEEFLRRQRCQYTSPRGRPTGTSTSSSKVVDFTALREQRASGKLSKLKRTGATKRHSVPGGGGP